MTGEDALVFCEEAEDSLTLCCLHLRCPLGKTLCVCEVARVSDWLGEEDWMWLGQVMIVVMILD